MISTLMKEKLAYSRETSFWQINECSQQCTRAGYSSNRCTPSLIWWNTVDQNLGEYKWFENLVGNYWEMITCLIYFCKTFRGLIIQMLRTHTFDIPQIRKNIRDTLYEDFMQKVELELWKYFVLVMMKFLGSI